MTFNTTDLPQPQPLERFMAVKLDYSGAVTEMECIGLSLVRIVDPPDYPDTECLLAHIVHEQAGPKAYQTSLFVIPVEFVTDLNCVCLPPDLQFLPPSREFFILPNKPAAKNRLPVSALKHRLGEFGIPFSHD